MEARALPRLLRTTSLAAPSAGGDAIEARRFGSHVGIRWTIGSARDRAYELLRLSVACAFRIFGAAARYRICVNGMESSEARQRTGPLPVDVEWRTTTAGDVPQFLRPLFPPAMAEGAGWKLAPLQSFSDRHEIALDNDCLLWDLPEGMRAWLQQDERCLIAEDTERCLGIFDAFCPPGNQNSGIRGLPPGFQLDSAMKAVLAKAQASLPAPLVLASELDEQGLQAAALSHAQPAYLVRTGEVTICSPFWPRSTELGTCGAHFVGSNVTHLPWKYFDRPADAWMEEFWQRHRPELYRLAGLDLPSSGVTPSSASHPNLSLAPAHESL